MDKLLKYKMAGAVEVETVQPRQYIIKAGKTSDTYFYIVHSGEVDYLEDTDDGDGSFVIVKTLQKGDHFGEQALLLSSSKLLNVRAKVETKLYKFSKEMFDKLKPSIEPYLTMDYLPEPRKSSKKQV